MTDGAVPATPTTTEVLLFPDMVRGVPNPRGWILKVWNPSDPEAREPHHVVALPIPRKVPLETWVARETGAAGTYRLELEPVNAPSAAARRHRLDRLQTTGPTSGFVTLTPEHVADAAKLSDPDDAAPAKRAEPKAQTSPAVLDKRQATELQKAENERLAAELENLRLRKELKKVNDDAPPPASPFAGLAALVAPFAPVLVQVVQTFLENQRATADALREVLTREHAPTVMPAAAPSGLSLGSLLELVPQLKELGKLVGGFTRRDDGDEKPASEAGEMIALVRDLLVGQAQAPAPVQEQIVPAANGAAPPAKRRLSPEEAMNLRVLRFMLAVLNEQRLTADPATTADRLLPEIGALPEEFRTLLVTSENVETLLAGLPKWLPANMRQSVPNAIRQDPRKHEWLETFLATVQELTAPEEPAERGGEPQ